MAILRDKVTGASVIAGTPRELVYIADQLGDEVIWDDVGDNFDPQAVKDLVQEELTSAQSVLTEETDPDVCSKLEEKCQVLTDLQTPDPERVAEASTNITVTRQQAETPL